MFCTPLGLMLTRDTMGIDSISVSFLSSRQGCCRASLVVVVQGLCLRALQGCLCRVLLHAAAGYCYNSGLRALELVRWCRCRVVL